MNHRARFTLAAVLAALTLSAGFRPAAAKGPATPVQAPFWTGKPTAAHIRRTCRFFPSRIASSTQLVGIAARKRIGASK